MRKNISGFYGSRLAQAREARGLSCADIARYVQVSRASVSNYEAGKQMPRPDVIEKISNIFNLPTSFFMFDVPKLQRNTIFYRSNNSAIKAAKIKAGRRYEWLREIALYLQEYFDFPKVNMPSFDLPDDFEKISMDQIEKIALKCRKYFGIDGGPAPNMILLLENNGVIVSQGYFEAEKLDAFSENILNEHPFVFLGLDKTSAVRSRFDAAHELAHLILHSSVKQTRINNKRSFKILEDQAHRFAGAFLLPEKDFLDELWSPTLDAFRALKPRWKASVGAQIMRSSQLEIVSDDQVKRLWINYNRRGWRNNEPLDDKLEREKCRVLRRSFELMVQENIRSKEQILEDLRLFPGDIVELAGLPSGFFSDREAEVVPLPKIRSLKTRSSSVLSERGKIIDFPKGE